jgi:ATP/ADP translocase
MTEKKGKNSDKIAELTSIREHYRTKAFYMMIEVAFIFGVPAAIAFFLGRKLDAVYESGKTIILSFLAVTFILSWIIVIFRYRKIDRDLRRTDEEIREAIAVKKEQSETSNKTFNQ